MQAPILSLRSEKGLSMTLSSRILGGKYLTLLSRSLGLPGERFFVRLDCDISLLCRHKRSINYTARTVCPSLREPTRAEWWGATVLFWVPIKSQTTTWRGSRRSADWEARLLKCLLKDIYGIRETSNLSIRDNSSEIWLEVVRSLN